MKEISAEILTPAQSVGAEKSWPAVFADLVKARLTTLVLLTTLVGFYDGWSGPMNFALMFNTLAATALVERGVIAEIRLGAASLAPYPVRLKQTEAALLGQALTRETVLAARRALLAEAQPIDDIRSTAEYRRRVAVNLLEEFLLELRREGSQP